MKLLPLKSLLRKQAAAHGFPDPIALLERIGRFSEPSEVAFPVELLRAGAVMHARGFLNSSILQYNLDWKWPYWINRQFDPSDNSFIPRAFSLTHINLTHRNWVAVGLPDIATYPVVDPAGLLTPYADSWSLELWVCDLNGRWHTSDSAQQIEQRLELENGLAVVTILTFPDFSLRVRADAIHTDNGPMCRLHGRLDTGRCQAMAIAVRPANPEGISFVHSISRLREQPGLEVDGIALHFDSAPNACHFSDYRQGDVFHQLDSQLPDSQGRSCAHGMATAIALFRYSGDAPQTLGCQLPLAGPGQHAASAAIVTWDEVLADTCRIQVPDPQFQYLTDAAMHSLILLSPGDVYPGSFTYKRFWFRDAAYMVSALLAVGLTKRAKRVLDNFSHRQLRSGYFRSQEGEWDSNGQVLWIFGQYFGATGELPDKRLLQSLIKGGEWIIGKRKGGKGHAHPGLLPPGFSAEHLGPNDYYYWDDFWSVAGLRALAQLCHDCGNQQQEARFSAEADDLQTCIDHSLARAATRLGRAAMPAAPQRRLDAAVIGSLVASYPLRLYAPDDEKLQDSMAYLKQHCLLKGAFFQQMIHSGINAYLTLHMAQTALRAGDEQFFALIDSIAHMATGAGQWPEAIHPGTGGGCMGDGQHGWAAAEWLLMMRNLFIREEDHAVILASGIPAQWLEPGTVLCCENSPVSGGLVSLEIRPAASSVELRWRSTWHGAPRPLLIALPGLPEYSPPETSGSITLKKD